MRIRVPHVDLTYAASLRAPYVRNDQTKTLLPYEILEENTHSDIDFMFPTESSSLILSPFLTKCLFLGYIGDEVCSRAAFTKCQRPSEVAKSKATLLFHVLQNRATSVTLTFQPTLQNLVSAQQSATLQFSIRIIMLLISLLHNSSWRLQKYYRRTFTN